MSTDKETKQPVMADMDRVMYSCGMEILHPGGLEKSMEMADHCRIVPGAKVLDIGCGKGITAIHLAGKYDCHITGIDLSPDMIAYANRRIEGTTLASKIQFLTADALNLPFDDSSFDVILAECVTTLLDREKAFREFLRVLKPDGYAGDLEMTWKTKPDEEIIRNAFELWDGFTTHTLAEWKDLFVQFGFSSVITCDFSDKMKNMASRYMKELGFSGIFKLSGHLMRNKALRKSMAAYNQFFKENKEYIGYGYVVGKKE